MSSEELIKIGYVIGGAILVMAAPLLNVLKKKSKILWANAKIMSQQSIYRILTDMRARLDVDRVAIIEFTNGEESLGNIPFIYSTMTYEVAALPIKSIKSEQQKRPSSWDAPIFAPLVVKDVHACTWDADGNCSVDGIKSVDVNAGFLIKGSQATSMVLMKFTANIGDGVIILTNYADDITLTPAQLTQLKSDVHQIWYHLKLKR